MRGGLPRRALRDVQLGEDQDVGVAKWAQRMRVLERDDRQVRFTDPAEQLRAHVVGAPRPRLPLDDVLERARGSFLVAALDGLRRENKESILGAQGLGIELYRGDVLVERTPPSGIRGDRVARPQERCVRFVLETREQRLVRRLVRRPGAGTPRAWASHAASAGSARCSSSGAAANSRSARTSRLFTSTSVTTNARPFSSSR